MSIQSRLYRWQNGWVGQIGLTGQQAGRHSSFCPLFYKFIFLHIISVSNMSIKMIWLYDNIAFEHDDLGGLCIENTLFKSFNSFEHFLANYLLFYRLDPLEIRYNPNRSIHKYMGLHMTSVSVLVFSFPSVLWKCFNTHIFLWFSF